MLLLFLITNFGCHLSSPAGSRMEISAWELANAEPVEMVHIARVRVDFNQPIPPHLTQQLAEEFYLLCISRPEDWSAVRRQLNLPAKPAHTDLSQGMIVGILANVGESTGHLWPIYIRAVRQRSGQGWLEASFAPGVYHPIKTAGYLDLVFVAGLKAVQIVHINRRTFIISPSDGKPSAVEPARQPVRIPAIEPQC